MYERDRSARVVAVVALPDAAHDSGSVAVAVARRWAAHGRDVLVVDADSSGPALASRLRKATRASFSPALRGVPSLMAARQPLAAAVLEEHCWHHGTAGEGSVRLLLGPTSTAGAPTAVAWLAQHTDGLLAANAGRHTIVSMAVPLRGSLEALRGAASAVVLLAPADTEERFEALCAASGSLIEAAPCCSPCVVLDGPAIRSHEEIHTASGLHVAGRLDTVHERALLGSRTRRRDAKAARTLDDLAARIAFLAADAGREEPGRDAPEQQLPQHGIVAPITDNSGPGPQRPIDGAASLGIANGGAVPLRTGR
ncbi:MAG: hypothetical protein F4X53_06645 [Acidimicrobiales bacterium]|nr:hypothetical protein [Acidimicrobiales bacterium]